MKVWLAVRYPDLAILRAFIYEPLCDYFIKEWNAKYIDNQDGRSYNGYPRGLEWKEIRLEIYKRDNYCCVECGVKCVGKNDMNEYNTHKIIQCHHIDGNKENNELDNLETLCLSCHGKKQNN